MLVLTRKLMQRIQIGGDIVLTVLEIRGNKVRLGVDAPRKVRVLRRVLHATYLDRTTGPPCAASQRWPGAACISPSMQRSYLDVGPCLLLLSQYALSVLGTNRSPVVTRSPRRLGIEFFAALFYGAERLSLVRFIAFGSDEPECQTSGIVRGRPRSS